MSHDFKTIANEILNKIDTYCQNTYDEGHRNHLGASLIGDSCKAKLWFTFRWIYHHKHSGRMQRLFNTGHKEEDRIIEWLRGAGYTVYNIDPKTNKQFQISDCNGHFGGSMDGIIFIPDLGECLLECKTNKDGSEFKKLTENGFQLEKEKHWAQVCSYGNKWHLRHVVYVNKNKNNDDLHIEVVELDQKHGQDQIVKAKEIINSQERPSRISETAAYFECKFCEYSNICHKGVQAEKNCRSCIYAVPVENSEWKCNCCNELIPKDFIKQGCDYWSSIL